MVKKIDYKAQGKRNRAAGADFERRTRKDLEEKGWKVSKYSNNIKLPNLDGCGVEHTSNSDHCGEKHLQEKYKYCDNCRKGKCVPAKPGRFRLMQTGFPDFFAYTNRFYMDEIIVDGGLEIPLVASDGKTPINEPQGRYAVIFIECKTNGYLSKEEKAKARWYLDNNYCSKFLIASKHKEKNNVIINYKESK